MKGVYHLPTGVEHAGPHKMPRVSLIMHRFNYAGSLYNIVPKGLLDGKCPGVQGHDDLAQVQYTQCQLFISDSPAV